MKGEEIQEKRHYFYVCEPDKKTGNKMKQMKLSFGRVPKDASYQGGEGYETHYSWRIIFRTLEFY